MAYAAAQVNFFEEPDDYVLDNNPDVIYANILDKFDFHIFRDEANLYYQSLADFNRKLIKKRQNKKPSHNSQITKSVTKNEMYQELLFEILEQNTSQKTILFTLPSIEFDPSELNRNPKGAGRNPKEFYALAKSFLGVNYMGLKNNPKTVYSQLINNPPFARKCGFKYVIDKRTKKCQHTVPSLRKIEHFDQLMNLYGIWDKMKWKIMTQNCNDGTIEIEPDLAFDPSHVEANSQFTTVETIDKNGKKQKRAIGKLSKRCSCSDKKYCKHEWNVTDQGCSVVVKTQHKKYWAHKASFVGFPKSHIPIDAVAVSYASTNDGQTLIPHLQRLQQHIPVVTAKTDRVIADGPFNTKTNKDFVETEIGAILYAPINPKNVKVPSARQIKGIDHFTKNGVPVCDAGFAFEMKGRELSQHRYIWESPMMEIKHTKLSACLFCLMKKNCCPDSRSRTLRTAASDFPQIDWDNPQHLSRWKKQYKKRTAIERMIKTIKIDYCVEQFNKRDSVNFQGHLDKAMLALHVLLSHSH